MKVVATVNTRSAAFNVCKQRGAERHSILPSNGGWDVLEMSAAEVLEAKRAHLLARAEELERSAGVYNVLSKASKRSAEQLITKAKDAITRALKLRAEAAALTVDTEPCAPAGATLQ